MSKTNNIYKLLSKGERVTLECKKATKGVPTSLWDTYSAHPTKSVAGLNQTPTIPDRKRTECPLPHAVGF